MALNFLMVGIGGFFGSGCRYMFGQIPIWEGMEFPFCTLIINFLGSFLIGVISSLSLGTRMNSMFKTGFCGGFTTFSTFSLETVGLIESGRIIAGSFYAVISVVICIIGVTLGNLVVRAFSAA